MFNFNNIKLYNNMFVNPFVREDPETLHEEVKRIRKRLTRKEEELKQRQRLHKSGLRDEEIGEIQGRSYGTIVSWRVRERLRGNNPKRMDLRSIGYGKEVERRESTFRDLYNQGLSDKEIAQQMDIPIGSVSIWRTRRNLDVNPTKTFIIKHDKRMELYKQGLIDSQIAKVLGTTESAIYMWRRMNKILMNRDSRLITDNRLDLYNQGLTDSEIAERSGVSYDTIQTWRLRRKLRPNFKPNI